MNRLDEIRERHRNGLALGQYSADVAFLIAEIDRQHPLREMGAGMGDIHIHRERSAGETTCFGSARSYCWLPRLSARICRLEKVTEAAKDLNSSARFVHVPGREPNWHVEIPETSITALRDALWGVAALEGKPRE